MNALLAAGAAFFLLHLFPSTPLRKQAIGWLGERLYLGIFATVSLITIWWLAHSYNHAAYGEKLWSMPAWWPWAMAALLLLVSILTVGGYSTPNPSFPGADRLLDRRAAAGGVFAITRHPLMWAVAIWAIAHILSQATARGLLFFGAFAATALVGSWLQEMRKRRDLGEEWNAFEEKTSFVPFAAMLQGRARLSLRAIGWWRLAIAILLWIAILAVHPWLFGVRPLPIGV
jgi:uncharacterized membrane protein